MSKAGETPAPRSLILASGAAPHLLTLLLRIRLGDSEGAQGAADALLDTDPAAATLAPILYAPFADRVEIVTPWLEDLIVYQPLIPNWNPVKLSELLGSACETGTLVRIVTRSGARDSTSIERLVIASRLSPECAEITIDEKIHTKAYRAIIGDTLIEAVSTANLVASEIWKTRVGRNTTLLRVRKLS